MLTKGVFVGKSTVCLHGESSLSAEGPVAAVPAGGAVIRGWQYRRKNSCELGTYRRKNVFLEDNFPSVGQKGNRKKRILRYSDCPNNG